MHRFFGALYFFEKFWVQNMPRGVFSVGEICRVSYTCRGSDINCPRIISLYKFRKLGIHLFSIKFEKSNGNSASQSIFFTLRTLN